MTDYDHHHNTPPPDEERLLTPGEVAAAFRVSTKSVSRWALAGKLPAVRTPTGKYRFRQADVTAALNGGQS